MTILCPGSLKWRPASWYEELTGMLHIYLCSMFVCSMFVTCLFCMTLSPHIYFIWCLCFLLKWDFWVSQCIVSLFEILICFSWYFYQKWKMNAKIVESWKTGLLDCCHRLYKRNSTYDMLTWKYFNINVDHGKSTAVCWNCSGPSTSVQWSHDEKFQNHQLSKFLL